MILCGGRGTRLQERTQLVPKPLVEIGGRPILWHVIQIYLAHGFTPVPAADRLSRRADRGVRRGRELAWWARRSAALRPGTTRRPAAASHLGARTLLDGGLLLRDLRRRRRRHRPRRALAYHREHGAAATMTVVRPRLQFGVAELNGDGVVRGVRREAAQRALGQRRLLLLRAGRARRCSHPTACSSASRSSAWPRRASCGRSATTASGTAWTPTRTRSTLNDLWAQGRAPWKLWN